jgi:hypothetical protein
VGARILPDSAYNDGVGLDQSWWRAIDAAQFAAWNGDLGSSHTASAPITIGGAGVMWAGPTQFQGVGPSAGVRTPVGSGARIVHGDSDYIEYQSLAANAVRTMLTACGRACDRSYASTPAFLAGSPYQATMRYSGGGARIVTTGGTGYLGGGRLSLALRVHHLGTLFAANLGFSIATSRTVPPVQQPKFRVIRVDAFGNVTILQNNFTPVAGYAGHGFVRMTATTGAGYYSAGAAQLFSIPFDTALNNPAVIVDITKYAYIAQVEDEADPAGTTSFPGNRWLSVSVLCINIPDQRAG